MTFCWRGHCRTRLSCPVCGAGHLLQKCPPLNVCQEGTGSWLKLSCSARQEGVNSISQCHMSKRLPLSEKLLSLTVLQIRQLFRVILFFFFFYTRFLQR